MTTFLIIVMTSTKSTRFAVRLRRHCKKLGDSNRFKVGGNVVWCRNALSSNNYFGVLQPPLTNLKTDPGADEIAGGEMVQWTYRDRYDGQDLYLKFEAGMRSNFEMVVVENFFRC